MSRKDATACRFLMMLGLRGRFALAWGHRGSCHWVLWLVVLGSFSGAMAQDFSNQEAAQNWFENKIRPILVDHCQDCHAADSDASGGLLLDSRDGWQMGGDSGAAILPGKAAESLLMQAMGYDEPDLQMPPDGKLPDDVIEDFRRWIDSGALDPRRGEGTVARQTGLPVERAAEHWSYRAPEASSSPLQSSTTWIDSQIEMGLRERGFAALPRATDSVLVRRLYFDLNGLPPSEKVIAEYEHSNAPDKYERLVDRLISSPRFGEHFARKWMDVVRYAESITLRGFVLPEAWRYRDYLVTCFNTDRPFDEMAVEQIAGDLIPREGLSVEQRQNQLIATGFLALGNTNLERQDKAQLDMDHVDEQLEVIGRAFLGQTIGCARCHDHKFDPIPTRDYYALAGIFRSAQAMEHDNVSKWIEEPLPLADNAAARKTELEQSQKLLAQEIREQEKQLKALAKYRKEQPLGIVLDTDVATLVGAWRSSTFTKGYFGDSYLVADMADPESGELSASYRPSDIQAGLYEVRLSYTPYKNRSSNLSVRIEHADGIATKQVDQRKLPEGERWLSLGQFRFDESSARVTLDAKLATGAVIADAVNFLPVEDLTQGDSKRAEAAVRRAARKQEAQALEAKLDELKRQEDRLKKELAAFPKYLTVREDPGEDIAVHIRGDVHNLGEVVPRGVLTAIGPKLPKPISVETSGRLAFARWLVNRQNPLTARVYANRVWMWLMGQGIVPTPNNFGTTGAAPTHPELLDLLAIHLQEQGWSTKALVRSIVLSEAYRRASYVPAQAKESMDSGVLAAMREMDPSNQAYWRGSRRRLSVESIRDAMLTHSGELDLEMRGATIRKGTKSDYDYKHQGTRRSIYHPVLRNSLPELYEAFDFANSSVSIGKRPRSTVATQGLVLMNHEWVLKRAERASELLMQECIDGESGALDEEKSVSLLYQRFLGRPPTDLERRIAAEFLQRPGDALESQAETLRLLVHSLFASLDYRYLD